jgi:hypothetical protein
VNKLNFVFKSILEEKVEIELFEEETIFISAFNAENFMKIR